MLGDVICISLSVIALLTIWHSHLFTHVIPIKPWVNNMVTGINSVALLYLMDCDQCKSFWLCLIGGLMAGNVWYTLPAYGLTIVLLELMEVEHGQREG